MNLGPYRSPPPVPRATFRSALPRRAGLALVVLLFGTFGTGLFQGRVARGESWSTIALRFVGVPAVACLVGWVWRRLRGGRAPDWP